MTLYVYGATYFSQYNVILARSNGATAVNTD